MGVSIDCTQPFSIGGTKSASDRVIPRDQETRHASVDQ